MVVSFTSICVTMVTVHATRFRHLDRLIDGQPHCEYFSLQCCHTCILAAFCMLRMRMSVCVSGIHTFKCDHVMNISHVKGRKKLSIDVFNCRFPSSTEAFMSVLVKSCEQKCPVSRAWFRSTDLWVMGPARFHCATLLGRLRSVQKLYEVGGSTQSINDQSTTVESFSSKPSTKMCSPRRGIEPRSPA